MNNHARPIIRGLATVAMALSIDSARAASSTALVDGLVSQTYTIRMQVVEGVKRARAAVEQVAKEYAYSGRALSVQLDTASLGNYVSGVVVDNGRIDITYGGLADAVIAGKTLSLTPYETLDDHVIWRCGNRPEPPNLSPLGTVFGSPASYSPSTVDDLYAATACAMVDGFSGAGLHRGDVIRGRVAQGLKLAGAAKRVVASNAGTTSALFAAATLFNSQNGGRGVSNPYVSSVQIDSTTGAITVQFNANQLGVGVGQDTLVLTPFVFISRGPQQLQSVIGSEEGTISWACASSMRAFAGSMGMAEATFGTLIGKYAPAQCR